MNETLRGTPVLCMLCSLVSIAGSEIPYLYLSCGRSEFLMPGRSLLQWPMPATVCCSTFKRVSPIGISYHSNMSFSSGAAWYRSDGSMESSRMSAWILRSDGDLDILDLGDGQEKVFDWNMFPLRKSMFGMRFFFNWSGLIQPVLYDRWLIADWWLCWMKRWGMVECLSNVYVFINPTSTRNFVSLIFHSDPLFQDLLHPTRVALFTVEFVFKQF